jgi:uncharacterized protein involved in exopolysaccharide biosynthesis
MATDQSDSIGFSELLSALDRRRMLILGIGLPIILAASLVAGLLPTMYRSTATYAIEEARLAGIGGGSGSQRESFADQYVKDLTERVLAPDSIRALLATEGALPSDRVAQNKAIAEKKRQIRVKVLSEQVLDPQSGRERTIISAFDINHDGATPEKARDGTAWLADAFITEDRKSRHERARGYTSFLVAEADRRKAQVDAIEGRLADFKQKNIGQLPESAGLNMEFRERAERDLADSESQLRQLIRERSFVQQNMNQYRGGPASARLQELEETYRDRLHTYDSNHPDMLALQREIQSLKDGQGGRTGGGTLREQLASQRDMLAQARQRYSEEHPDIARMKRQVAALEQRIASGESADKDTSPVSATELQLRTQLNSLNEQIASLQARTGETRARISSIQTKIQSSPQVEREYQLLNQDLSVARASYQDVLQKRIDADAAEAAIDSGSADAFRMTQRPTLPEKSVKSSGIAIVAAGILLGLTLALGTALIAEMMDSTVRGSRDIRRVLGVVPLGIIPEITNSATLSARRGRWMKLAATVCVATVVLFSVGYKLAA